MNLIIPSKIRVATGLYSHWDSIIKIDKKILKWIEKQKKSKPKSTVLNSIEELVYTLKNSNGDNESLISKKVYDELNSLFPKRKLRTGGNGNNMGRALFDFGIVPLVSYPVRPEKLMKASPKFKIACKNDFKAPIETIRKNDAEYDHIIFESEKWRNIFSWDLMSSQGIFDEDFLKFAFNPEFIDIAIISYAHLLLPEFKEKTDFLLDFIKNKRPKMHLEFGIGCKDSMEYAMEKFSEHNTCDSWGLDEKECKVYFNAGSENMNDLIESTVKAAKEYSLKRICVHSSKFAFSVSKYDFEKEKEALKAGCLSASLKSSGKIGLQSGKILKRKINGYNFCLVPSFFNQRIKTSTGKRGNSNEGMCARTGHHR